MAGQRTREGRTHLFLVEQLSFNFAGFQHFFSEGLKDCFRTQLKAEPLHASNQPSLAMPDRREALRQALSAPCEGGPRRMKMRTMPTL